ncbi:MAG: hypothetical protein KA604_02615 [Candidatus Saccharimonas sp.]|nr:hypothetical protein [Candidatus Saccharimonas sp.]
MNSLFTFWPQLFGVFPNGWLAIIVALVVGGFIAAVASARTGTSAWPLALLLGAVVFYAGFQWSAPGWVVLVFWLVWAVALWRWLADALTSGSSHASWRVARLGAVLALVGSIVLASNVANGQITWPWNSAIDKAKAEVEEAETLAHEAMVKSIQAQFDALPRIDTTSLKTECKSTPNICKKLEELEQRLGKVEASDAQQWAAMLKAGVVAVPADADTDAMAKALADAFTKAGFDGVRIGNNVDWSLPGANQRSSSAFGQTTLRTQAQVVEYLNSPAGAAAKQNLLDNTPVSLHDYFLSGKGFIPWQAPGASCTIGNWTLLNGKPKQLDAEVCHDVGDVWWTPVGPDGTVYMPASVRAACQNPHTSVTPYPKGKTPKVCPAGSDRAGKPIANGCYTKHPKTCTETGTCPPPTNCPTGTFWSDKWKECLESKLAGTPTGSLAPSPTTPHETVAPSPVPTPATTATPTVPAGGASPTPTPTASVPGGTATPSAGTPIPTPTG